MDHAEFIEKKQKLGLAVLRLIIALLLCAAAAGLGAGAYVTIKCVPQASCRAAEKRAGASDWPGVAPEGHGQRVTCGLKWRPELSFASSAPGGVSGATAPAPAAHSCLLLSQER